MSDEGGIGAVAMARWLLGTLGAAVVVVVGGIALGVLVVTVTVGALTRARYVPGVLELVRAGPLAVLVWGCWRLLGAFYRDDIGRRERVAALLVGVALLAFGTYVLEVGVRACMDDVVVAAVVPSTRCGSPAPLWRAAPPVGYGAIAGGVGVATGALLDWIRLASDGGPGEATQ